MDDYGMYDRQPFGPPFGPPFGGQGGQFGPPFGPPFGGQGGQFQPPFGAGAGQSGPPSGPPPSFVPQQAAAQTLAGDGIGVLAVDPGAIRPCRFRFVYLWLRGGRQFWAWLVFVGRDSVAGWRWTGFNWVYFGVDLRRIVSFVCY